MGQEIFKINTFNISLAKAEHFEKKKEENIYTGY